MACCSRSVVFLPWYGTNADNRNANIDGATGSLSGFTVHPILSWLLLAAASAPLILAWIIARDHELSWPRGEMTAVVAMIAHRADPLRRLHRPSGRPSSQISLQFGWFVALLGAVLMLVGGATRAGGTERPRKPPGVL